MDFPTIVWHGTEGMFDTHALVHITPDIWSIKNRLIIKLIMQVVANSRDKSIKPNY